MGTADLPTVCEGPCCQRALALVMGARVQLSQSPVGWEEQRCRPLLSPAPEARFLGHQPWTKSPCETAGNSLHLQTVKDGQPTQNPEEQSVRPHKSPRHSAQPGCAYLLPSPRLPKAALISQEDLCSTVEANRYVLQAFLLTSQPSPQTMTSGAGQGTTAFEQRLQLPPPHRSLKSHAQMLLHLFTERHNEVSLDEWPG